MKYEVLTGLHLWLDFLCYNKYNSKCGGGYAMRTGCPRTDHVKCKSITVQLSEGTHEKLLAYTTEHKVTMTEVVLKSLKNYLSKP